MKGLGLEVSVRKGRALVLRQFVLMHLGPPTKSLTAWNRDNIKGVYVCVM